MADPFTLSFIAANCAWALIQNRVDEAAVQGAKALAENFRRQRTPANHDVLKATHSAFVRSIQLMAEACDQDGADAKDHFVVQKLTRLARDRDFATFREQSRRVQLSTPRRENSRV